MEPIKDGDLYRLIKLKGTDELRTWCRHNLILAVERDDGRIALVDTYWGGSPSKSYAPDDIAEMALLGNLGDFDETSKDVWEQVGEADRISIPMGGYPERWLIRKGSAMDVGEQIKAFYKKARKAKSDMDFAKYQLGEAREQLTNALARATPEQLQRINDEWLYLDELRKVL